MREMEVSKASKDSLKRRLDRNRMILKRRMRRFIKVQQLEEEQRILAEEAAARLRRKWEDVDNELEEDDEFKNLSDIEKPIVGHITDGQNFVLKKTILCCQQSQNMHSMICSQDTASKARSI